MRWIPTYSYKSETMCTGVLVMPVFYGFYWTNIDKRMRYEPQHKGMIIYEYAYIWNNQHDTYIECNKTDSSFLWVLLNKH